MRQHFLNLLCAAVSDVRSRIRVVITLRADYYDRPLHYPDFGQLVRSQMETILPLSAKGLERAIRGPAERVGVSFEQGLVEQIVSQMNYQAGALPLLQYALTELFDRREGRLLTNRAYQEIGGAVGALANRADEIYRSLSPDAQELAHQMFMRMVTLGEGAEDTRRRANQSELLSLTSNTDLMEEIIDQFAAYRLLSLDHDPLTRQPTVEVAHEAILREWERLRQWLNESRTEIRLQQQLNHMASEWRNARQDTSFLMHGSRLEQFEAWAKQTQLVLTPHEQQFLQESLEQRNSLAIQERERQVREEAQEKRSRTLLRALVAVFALATILSGGLAIFALDRGNVALAAQAQIATEQANTLDALDIAQRSGLAFAANAAIELNDIDLAVALVNESAGDHSDILPETLRVAEKLAQTGGPSLVVDTQQVCWGHISLDARYYIASDCGSYMSIFEMATGQMVFENTFEATPTQFNFSADSSYFLTSTDNLNYTLWDVATWQVINQLTIEKNGTLPLNYVGDSPLVAFLEVPDERMSDYENGFETSGNAFAIYDMALGIFVKRIEFPNEFLSWINFSQDGSLGVVGGFASNEGPGRQHYRLIVFDVMSGDILNTIDLPHNQNEDQNYAATWIAFSPDNTSLYLSGEPNYFINWQSGEIIDSFSIASDVRTGYPDRTLRYVTYQDDATQDRVMRYLATGEEIRFQNFASIAPTNIPNHILVKYHGRLHEYVLWDVLGQDTNSTTLDYPLSVTAVDFNPRGTQFIAVSNAWGTGTDTGTSTIFDANTLEEIRHLDTGLNLGFDVAWSPDGKLIATTTFADGVFLWDAQTGERLHVLDDIPDDSVYFVEFTYDSRYILSGQGTFVSTFTSNEIASLYMWDTASGELVKRIELPVETVPHWGLQMIEASPVENIVYVSVGTVFVPGGIGATYRTFRINLDTLEIVELSFGFNMLWSDFTPDGEYWITSSFVGNDIIVVDVATNEIVRSWQTLENDIWGVSMSSDGTMLATGSGVQSVETIVSLWDFETGTLIRRYLGHTEQAFMLDVTFRPDGTQIASTAFDRTLRIWDVDRLSTLNWLSENRFLREFTCSERIQYRIEPYCEE
jgi:WD40 repeat protein